MSPIVPALPPSALRPPPSLCGPACTKCGCADTTILKEPVEPEWFPSGQAQCNCCGETFSYRNAEQDGADQAEDEGRRGEKVQEVPTRCPNCESLNCPVTGTKGRLRSRRCGDCGTTFQSIRPER
jgi:translation initiation factor 2 beta subunit (eIF-2beta)/eIF-5